MNTKNIIKKAFGISFCLLFVVIKSYSEIKLTLPFSYESPNVTCGFYCYYFNDNVNTPHGGTDYQFTTSEESKGQPILAAASGLAHAQEVKGYGNLITITHDSQNDGHVYVTKYAHLESFGPGIDLNSEVYVERGQIIGYCGNSGGPWIQNDGNMGSPYHLHFEVIIDNKKVDPYDSVKCLWSTNPPSHAFFTDNTIFNFTNHSSDGWIHGYESKYIEQSQKDQDTWMVLANGSNPGVVSPSFSKGITTDQFKNIRFSAKINTTGSQANGQLWIKDGTGNWNHYTSINNVQKDQEYHEYNADISQMPNLDISQFSIELTDNANNEYWIFDWLKLLSSYTKWDFKDNQMGWILKNGKTKCFCTPGNINLKEQWEIDPNLDVQLLSPYLLNVNASDFSILKIALSSSKCQAGKNVLKIFFKNEGDDSFTEEKTVQISIVDDGVLHPYSICMKNNPNWKGQIQQIRIDPIIDGYKESTDNVRIDYISFEKDILSSISSCYLTEAKPIAYDKVAINYAMSEIPVEEYVVNLYQDGSQIQQSSGQEKSFLVSSLVPGSTHEYALSSSVIVDNVSYESSKSTSISVTTNQASVTHVQKEYYADAEDASLYYFDPNYENCRNNSSGILNKNGSGITIGQEKGDQYYIHRAILPFNTSEIPEDAIITDARIYLCGQTIDLSNIDFMITIVDVNLENPPIVQSTDFNEFSTINCGRINATSVNSGSYNEIRLNTDGIKLIKKGAYSILGLRSSNDIYNAQPNDKEYISFYSSNNFSDNSKPKLIVKYDLPSQIIEPTVYSPNPANNETGVSRTNVTFKWVGYNPYGNSNPIDYQIFFGTDSTNLESIRGYDKSCSYEYATLEGYTQYYWRILMRDSQGVVTEGPVWRFKTANEIPDIEVLSVAVDGIIKQNKTVQIKAAIFNVGTYGIAGTVYFYLGDTPNSMTNCIGTYGFGGLEPGQQIIASRNVEINSLCEGDNYFIAKVISYDMESDTTNNINYYYYQYQDTTPPTIDYFQIQWGEKLLKGSEYKIVTKIEDDLNIANIQFHVSYNKGSTWDILYQDSTIHNGYYLTSLPWKVPNEAAICDSCLLFKVVVYDQVKNRTEKITDVFSIIDGTYPVIEFIEPKADKFYLGDSCLIKWHAEAESGIINVRLKICYGKNLVEFIGNVKNADEYRWRIPENSNFISNEAYILAEVYANNNLTTTGKSDNFIISDSSICQSPWNKSMILSPEPDTCAYLDNIHKSFYNYIEDVKVGPNGDIHLVYVDEYNFLNANGSNSSLGNRKNIYYMKRTNGGWTLPIAITSYPFELNTSMSRKGFRNISDVKMAIDHHNHPHIVYKAGTELEYPKYDDNIFVTSYDGINWSEPENLSKNDSTKCINPQIAFDEFYDPHVVWNEISNGSYSLMHRYNIDGKWEEKELLQNNLRSDISMTGNASGLHLVFVKNMTYGSKLQYTKYKNATWSTPTFIDSIQNMSNSFYSDSYYPTISVTGDDIYVAYILSSFKNGSYDFEQLAVSKSHNNVWTKEPEILIGKGADCPCARVGDIKFDSNNNAHLFWQEYDGVSTRIEYSKETRNGWIKKMQVSSKSEGTAEYRLSTCIKDDTAFVFYNAYNKGNNEIFFNFADLSCKQTITNNQYILCQNDTLKINGHTYFNNGIYTDTLISNSGCDSIIETTLTLLPIKRDTITVLLCPNDSIVFSNKHIFSEGIYQDTLKSSLGCDSIVTLIVSKQSLLLEKKYYSICKGEEFEGLTKAGIFLTHITLTNGCIYTRELHLQVNPAYNDTLFYTIDKGENYCGYNKNGVYTMYLRTYLGCDSIVTIILNVDSIHNGLENSSLTKFCFAYPNPTKNKLWIKLAQPFSKSFRIEILNPIGDILFSEMKNNEHKDIEIDISGYLSGLYIVRIFNDSEIIILKIMKI